MLLSLNILTSSFINYLFDSLIKIINETIWSISIGLKLGLNFPFTLSHSLGFSDINFPFFID